MLYSRPPSGCDTTWYDGKNQGWTGDQLESFASLSQVSRKRYAECQHYWFEVNDSDQFHNAELYHHSHAALS